MANPHSYRGLLSLTMFTKKGLVVLFLSIVFLCGCKKQLRSLEVTNTVRTDVYVKIDTRVMPDIITAGNTTTLGEQIFRGGTFECKIVGLDYKPIKVVTLSAEELNQADDGQTIKIRL